MVFAGKSPALINLADFSKPRWLTLSAPKKVRQVSIIMSEVFYFFVLLVCMCVCFRKLLDFDAII